MQQARKAPSQSQRVNRVINNSTEESRVVAETMAIGDPQELPSGSGAGGRGSAAATRGPDTPRAGQRPLRRQGPLDLDGT